MKASQETINLEIHKVFWGKLVWAKEAEKTGVGAPPTSKDV